MNISELFCIFDIGSRIIGYLTLFEAISLSQLNSLFYSLVRENFNISYVFKRLLETRFNYFDKITVFNGSETIEPIDIQILIERETGALDYILFQIFSSKILPLVKENGKIVDWDWKLLEKLFTRYRFVEEFTKKLLKTFENSIELPQINLPNDLLSGTKFRKIFVKRNFSDTDIFYCYITNFHSINTEIYSKIDRKEYIFHLTISIFRGNKMTNYHSSDRNYGLNLLANLAYMRAMQCGTYVINNRTIFIKNGNARVFYKDISKKYRITENR